MFLLFNQVLADDLFSRIRKQDRISASSADICRSSSKVVHFRVCFLCCDLKKTFSYLISQWNQFGFTLCFRAYWLFAVTSKTPSESTADLFSFSGSDRVLLFEPWTSLYHTEYFQLKCLGSFWLKDAVWQSWCFWTVFLRFVILSFLYSLWGRQSLKEQFHMLSIFLYSFEKCAQLLYMCMYECICIFISDWNRDSIRNENLIQQALSYQ